MNNSSTQKELDRIREAAEVAEEEVITKYRDSYIVPFCDKRMIQLSCGMGTWDLIDQQGRRYGDEWEGRPIPKYIRDILEAETLNRYNDAGSLMESYTRPWIALARTNCVGLFVNVRGRGIRSITQSIINSVLH